MAEPELYATAFPTLDEGQIASLGRCARTSAKHFRDGEILFAVADRNPQFFVIRSGEVEIIDHTGGEPRTVVVHRKGQFTGEISHLTGAPAVVSAVARGDCEAYQIAPDDLRRILNQCPTLSDIILQAFISRRQLLRASPSFTGLRVIGSRYSHDTFRIRDFLARNRVLFTWVDLEDDPQVDALLRQFGMSEADTPVVACGRMLVLRNPSNAALADAIGLRRDLDQVVYDLVVVGGGPAGLAAAVYAASEGLRTVVLERSAPGGQAGSSMRIENYLGFPTGITGAELTDRATLQANKFGARLHVPAQLDRLTFDKAYPVLHLDGGETTVTSKCLLIATGADYNRLGVQGCERFEGSGIYYAATPNEAKLCHDCEVIVVGGGNSAGQAAVFLAGHARRVLLLIRGDDLYKNMSSYLARRIEGSPGIELCRNTTVRRMHGEGHLDAVEITNAKSGQERTVQTPAVFSFIGATPRTEWLPQEIEIDAKGFVRTGPALARSSSWTARRPPFLLETSKPGVFAAGDVRSGSVKRVASAVGEGSMAVQFVHEYLKEM
jgi:thioredoxin reductase (NADPH)